VAPQAEQVGGPGPSEAYLDWLDELTATRFGAIRKEGLAYVSRGATSRRLAGETYLEEALSRSGVRVVRPEALSLPELLRSCACARDLICAGGSALHSAQLMGRALGYVTVLQRTPRSYIGRASVQPRSKSLRYIQALRGVLHGATRIGSISVLDEDILIEELEDLGIPLQSHWRSEEFAARRDADVGEWLGARNDSDIPGSTEHIEKTLSDAGLGHLKDLL
jgi:hypothetical protein